MKTYQNIMQDEVNLPWTLLENSVFGAWILLEFYFHKPARTLLITWTVLLQRWWLFIRICQSGTKIMRIEKSVDKYFTFSFHFEFNVTLWRTQCALHSCVKWFSTFNYLQCWVTTTCSLLGLCFFKDSDYLSEFAKTGQAKLTHKSCKEGKDSTIALPFFSHQSSRGSDCTVVESWPSLPTCTVVNRNRLSDTSNLLNNIHEWPNTSDKALVALLISFFCFMKQRI